jgi:hypothetical protein
MVAHMADPVGQLATFDWLQHRSLLGNLIEYSFSGMGLEALSRFSTKCAYQRSAGTFYMRREDDGKITQAGRSFENKFTSQESAEKKLIHAHRQ